MPQKVQRDLSEYAPNPPFYSQLDSVEVWKAFVSTYPLELHPSSRCKHYTVERPNRGLGDYIKPICSPSFDWITFLTLSNITCARTDLIRISQLPNVGALTIGPDVVADEHGLDDGIVRTWARTAVTADAFTMLRVLCCRSQKDITHRVFSYLNQFPVLAIFNSENCDLTYQLNSDALRYGWKYRTGEVLSERLIKSGAKRTEWNSVVHASFQLGGSCCRESSMMPGVEAFDRLPRLHLSIGGLPRAAAESLAGDESIKSFYRTGAIASRSDNSLNSSLNKRRLGQSYFLSNRNVLKRPRIRSSKEQSIEASLSGIAG